jgi:hypothetical protein
VLLQRNHKTINKFTEKDSDYLLAFEFLRQCLIKSRTKDVENKTDGLSCLRSLTFTGMDTRMEDITQPERNTCDWLFDTAEFQRWAQRNDISSHNGVFWIQGHPGTGKSTLMKHLLLRCKRELWTIAPFFFTARGNKNECSPLGMYRSLVWHLADRNPVSFEALFRLYTDKMVKYGECQWRETELQQFILDDIKRHKRLLIIVDALDECVEKDVASVVSFLEKLSLTAVESEISLNIALSSRHYPIIDMEIRELLLLDTHPKHVEDIKTYIKNRLLVTEMADQLLHQSNGVFMWLVLVVEMLNKAHREGRVREWRDILDQLPSDLDDLYSALMKTYKIDPRYTLPMFVWILFSETPLTYTDLYAALMMETEQKPRQFDSHETRDVIQKFLTSCSLGLVEINSIDRIQFIHKTVPDFLQRQGRLTRLDKRFNPIPDSCYTYMALICGKYLHMTARGVSYPFHSHALEFMIKYMKFASEEKYVSGEFLFYSQLPIVAEFYTVRIRSSGSDYQPSDGPGPAFYKLIYTKSFDLIYELAYIRWNLDARGGYYGNALHAAAAEGLEDAVKVLIDAGATVDVPDGELGTALRAAAVWGHRGVVKLLLDVGADVTLRAGKFNSPLQAAVGACHKDIVTMMRLHQEANRPQKLIGSKTEVRGRISKFFKGH